MIININFYCILFIYFFSSTIKIESKTCNLLEFQCDAKFYCILFILSFFADNKKLSLQINLILKLIYFIYFVVFRLEQTTTHVVLTFATHDSSNQDVLDVELVPSSWVFRKDKKWLCLYPSAKEYNKIDSWCKKRAPPKKLGILWSVHNKSM